MSQNSNTYPPARIAMFGVFILMLAYMISFIDRQIMSSMYAAGAFASLDFTNFQISLLMGFAFALFYAALGIPLGVAVDRYSRKTIIAIGVTVWCLMTAACGLATGFFGLFVARMGVGVGEAALAPAANSIISDSFPREKRAWALSVYNMGISLGLAFAFIIGGQLIGWRMTIGVVDWPVLGAMEPWQTIFVIVGLPGLLIAGLVLTIKEPARQELTVSTNKVSIGETLAYVKARYTTYVYLFLGMSIMTLIGYGQFTWLPKVMMGTWGWSVQEMSLVYGILVGVCGPVGVNLYGYLANRSYAAGHKGGHLQLAIRIAVVLVITSAIQPLITNPWVSVAFLAVSNVCNAAVTAAGAASLMMVAPNQMRGQLTAMFFFTISIVGLTIGSSGPAVLTDFVLKDPTMIPTSMAIIFLVVGGAQVMLLRMASSSYEDSVIEAEAAV